MKNYYILRLKARKTEKTERKKERKKERKFNPQSQYNHIFDCLLVGHLSNIRRSLVPNKAFGVVVVLLYHFQLCPP